MQKSPASRNAGQEDNENSSVKMRDAIMVSKIKKKSQKEIAQDTVEFSFEKPNDFQYIAGQNVNIGLPRLLYDDKKGSRRTFTLSSAPHEDDLIITTRMTGSGFKKTLFEIEAGQELEFIGPMGELVLKENVERAIFLAGGIGITPFRSMICDAEQKNLSIPLTLLSANRNFQLIVYHDYFEKMADRYDFFQYIPTLTRLTEEEQSWKGERGYIDASFLKRYIDDISSPDYYLCGPPRMVNSVMQVLNNIEIPEERIHSESFWGY